jgi:hypothetical protein
MKAQGIPNGTLHTKYQFVKYFGGHRNWKMFVNFTAISTILRYLGIFSDHLAHTFTLRYVVPKKLASLMHTVCHMANCFTGLQNPRDRLIRPIPSDEKCWAPIYNTGLCCFSRLCVVWGNFPVTVRVARFFLLQHTKTGNIYVQKAIKCTQRP